MLLEVENLSVQFETRQGVLEAVRNISFHLEKGETLGIVGESGCGKSVTNMAMMGLLPNTAKVTADKLALAGQPLLELPEDKLCAIRGKEMAMIFQDPMTALNPSLTVLYQIDETLKIHRPELSKKDRYDRAVELMLQVGIPAPKERLNAFAHELSGGMAQRVMIAIALACHPKLLIADEPTTALDVTIQAQILKLLKDLQEQEDMAMILVTHDLGVVAQNADRIQVMYAGEVVEAGAIREVIEKPRHPYTEGLLNSLPHGPKGKSERVFRGRLPSIEGLVPDLFHRPMGCQFSPRCTYADARCHNELPELELGQLAGMECSLKCFHPLEVQA